MNEEIILLEEQVAAAQADIERLQERLAEAESLATSRGQELTELRRQVDAARGEAETQRSEAESLRAAVSGAESRSREALQRYREAALAHEPELPADLVAGESVEELDAALERARQVVSQVRQRMEEQAQSPRVSPGAPVRGPAEASGLTPAEKIRLGLQQQ